MATKVEITEKYNDTIVCKGKLILLDKNVEEKVMLQLHNRAGRLNPIIISENETVEAGDIIAHNEFGIGKIISRKATGKYWICEFNGITETVIGVFKILAMPLDFSSEQLQMIVDGKFNHEDNVWVECEIHDEWLKENPPFAGPYERSELYYQIKLKDNHIILHEIVPPNPNNYPTKCYCGHTTWCECVPVDESWDDIYKRYEDTIDPMTRSANHHDHVLQWLKEHYNSPKKK